MFPIPLLCSALLCSRYPTTAPRLYTRSLCCADSANPSLIGLKLASHTLSDLVLIRPSPYAEAYGLQAAQSGLGYTFARGLRTLLLGGVDCYLRVLQSITFRNTVWFRVTCVIRLLCALTIFESSNLLFFTVLLCKISPSHLSFTPVVFF